MTLFYPNHTITIKRNRQKGSANRWGMSATFTVFSADVQPSGSQQQYPDRWGNVFEAYVDTSDNVKEGDQVITEDGKKYSVKSVKRWEGGGIFNDIDHLELVLVALDG